MDSGKDRDMSATVLVTDYAWPSLDIERQILAGIDAELLVAEKGDEEELVALAPRADAILTNWKKVPAAALDAAERCRVVSRYGVGVDNIPVEHATGLGIVVTNVPDFCLDEVSDHAMALLLACARRIPKLEAATKSGIWSVGLAYGMSRLRGQTLGLVGFGNIARVLAPKAAAFGLKVIAYTPRGTSSTDTAVERTNHLEQLLSVSDFVSLHAPSTPSTRGLIGRAELRAMKPTAYLINTARGALIDDEALLEAINEGWIAGAALDVLAVEPPAPGNQLMQLENVLVTPHVAFYSEQAIQELQEKAARNVMTVLRGDVPASVVNRTVLQQPNRLSSPV